MAQTDIAYPKAAGNTITSADYNKILKAIGTSDVDLLDADRLDIKTQKLEMVIQSADPTGGELREGLLWYLTGGILKFRNSSATRIVATLEDAQTFSAVKTFSATPKTDAIDERTADTGVTIDGILLKDDFFEIDEIAAPSNPAANKLRIYCRDVSGTTVLASKDSAGVETLHNGSSFAKLKATAVTAWEIEQDMLLGDVANDLIATVGIGPEISTRATTKAFTGGISVGTRPDTGGTATSLTAGDIVEMVCTVKFTGFANLTGSNLAGVGFVLDSADSGAAIFIKTGNTPQRAIVGVDSAGDVFLVTASGGGVTATDTGFNATSGAKFKVYIKWTVGTSVYCELNDGNATTVSTTLPTQFYGYQFGQAASGGGGMSSIFYGGSVKAKTA